MDLTAELQEKIYFGHKLLSSLQKFGKLDGLEKLQRKIQQELKFLKKVQETKQLKKEHLQCSNLTHFAALVKVLEEVKKVLFVNKVFVFESRKLTVDIVCDDGLTWTKVIARNPKSVSQICEGNASFGVRSIVDQAEEFVECARLHPCSFQTPQVAFVFQHKVSSEVVMQLEELGVKVQNGFEIKEKQSSDCSFNENLKVNLDVSAMLAYCSSVTNGSAGLYDFQVPVLKQQAAWELIRPQKPILDQVFQGKQLFCCETAYKSFQSICQTVGGPQEKIRAEQLLERVTVLPDDFEEPNNELKQQLKNLEIGGKIKERSLTIFQFGDRIKAVTVTSNDGFIRAAKQQGINFVVFVHESRALTEQKELQRGTKVSFA